MPGQSELGHRGPVVYRCAHDTGCLVQSSDTGRARRLVIDLDMVYSDQSETHILVSTRKREDATL